MIQNHQIWNLYDKLSTMTIVQAFTAIWKITFEQAVDVFKLVKEKEKWVYWIKFDFKS